MRPSGLPRARAGRPGVRHDGTVTVGPLHDTDIEPDTFRDILDLLNHHVRVTATTTRRLRAFALASPCPLGDSACQEA